MLNLFNKQLAQSVHLTDAQIAAAVTQLVDESVPAEHKADFLCCLARKIETPPEIAAFARELRAKSIVPPLDAETRSRTILDVCGTGGDRLNTFNISTTVALICASAGITVAKHGNRAVTSQAGSADVLETLGVRIELSPDEAAQSLRDHHFAFFFAPHFHPAFKHISAARKICAQRGQRTIFNFLGPLLNPARPSAQLVGVARPELCSTLSRVLQSLGVRRGMVVSGQVGGAWLDELSTLGENTVAEFYQDHGFAASVISPAHFPLQAAALADLAGGDRQANAEIIRRLLRNEDRGPKRDAVLLNAGAALFVAGHTKSISEGWDLADDLLASGRANAKLTELTE
ncbi:MAG: Anthranilate phosphoribosyltransferase [Pedosphaera sp.]|nr:Anthranilate phosphoribosyltransferase [Pedosphaera sp.]